LPAALDRCLLTGTLTDSTTSIDGRTNAAVRLSDIAAHHSFSIACIARWAFNAKPFLALCRWMFITTAFLTILHHVYFPILVSNKYWTALLSFVLFCRGASVIVITRLTISRSCRGARQENQSYEQTEQQCEPFGR